MFPRRIGSSRISSSLIGHGTAAALFPIGGSLRALFLSAITTLHPSWPSLTQRCAFTGRALLGGQGSSVRKPSVQTLAIETSCDDTSVAVLSVSTVGNDDGAGLRSKVLFHDKVTSNSHQYSGIHPLVALESHQKELATLVQKAVRALEPVQRRNGDPPGEELPTYERRPDFVSVTRGPGMGSNLSVGLNLAKGLAIAWDCPLLGIHHMQAHALTPRLCNTLPSSSSKGTGSGVEGQIWTPKQLEPRFPFLTLLVSGGHTMLIDSQSLTEHVMLAETQDIAIGDYLDKAARAILLASELKIPYGKALEDFAFPSAQNSFDAYKPPKTRQEEIEGWSTQHGWTLRPPLAESGSGDKSSRRMIYTFSGLLSSILRLPGLAGSTDEGTPGCSQQNTRSMPNAVRRDLARETMRLAFEHLGSRILLHLESSGIPKKVSTPYTVVVSGGVASNKFLRHVLQSMLAARGYSNVNFCFPPPELCTDNALMIAWAGMEMYDAGFQSDMSIKPLRKWSMDPIAEDGGILGVGGWKRIDGD